LLHARFDLRCGRCASWGDDERPSTDAELYIRFFTDSIKVRKTRAAEIVVRGYTLEKLSLRPELILNVRMAGKLPEAIANRGGRGLVTSLNDMVRVLNDVISGHKPG